LPKPAEHEIEQLPAEQVGVPLADEHAAPHPPQLAVLVLMFVSQPFELLPSQLPKPASQPTSWQVPLAHDSVAFAMSQATPHAPQLVSVFRLVSQPLVGSPSQFANPEAQVGTQAPPVHVVVPLALEQTFPQEPQFAELVLRFASQPSAALPSQFPKPALHVRIPHVPDEHVAVAFKSEQTVPQLPQFAVLLCVFVSQPFVASPSQFPQPGTHVGAHAPEVQVVVPCRLVHPFPQEPQLVRLVWVFVSQPFAPFESQLAKPGPQLPSVQTPLTQLSLALARSHGALQAPQSVSVLMLRSQPLSGLPSQLA
jgi:hypothetical protein